MFRIAASAGCDSTPTCTNVVSLDFQNRSLVDVYDSLKNKSRENLFSPHATDVAKRVFVEALDREFMNLLRIVRSTPVSVELETMKDLLQDLALGTRDLNKNLSENLFVTVGDIEKKIMKQREPFALIEFPYDELLNSIVRLEFGVECIEKIKQLVTHMLEAEKSCKQSNELKRYFELSEKIDEKIATGDRDGRKCYFLSRHCKYAPSILPDKTTASPILDDKTMCTTFKK